MMDLPFEIPERTDFTDNGYAVLGRALTIATEFEHNCAALSSLLGMQKSKKPFSDDDEIQKFVKRIGNSGLFKQIKLIGNQSFGGHGEHILIAGKDARNYVAHDAAVGISRILENDGARANILNELGHNVRLIADANLLVLVLSQIYTSEPIPRHEYLNSYSQRIADWACSP